jgi:hypothetical protein
MGEMAIVQIVSAAGVLVASQERPAAAAQQRVNPHAASAAISAPECGNFGEHIWGTPASLDSVATISGPADRDKGHADVV